MINQKGFTLLETLIYITLFTVIIGGGIVAVYQIIQSTDASYSHIILQEEANFLFRKIDWAATGADSINVGSSTLEVSKPSTTLTFAQEGDNLTLQGIPLNSESIIVSSVSFVKTDPVGEKPASVTSNFTLTTEQNNWPATQNFSFTKYLRKVSP